LIVEIRLTQFHRKVKVKNAIITEWEKNIMWGRETPSLPFDGREGVSESASFLFAIGVFLLGLFGLFGIVDGNRLWFGGLGLGFDSCPFLCCSLSLAVFLIELGELLG